MFNQFEFIFKFINYRQPPWLDDFQEYTNTFFVALFTLEMLLKMYSLGFQVCISSSIYLIKIVDWQLHKHV